MIFKIIVISHKVIKSRVFYFEGFDLFISKKKKKGVIIIQVLMERLKISAK